MNKTSRVASTAAALLAGAAVVLAAALGATAHQRAPAATDRVVEPLPADAVEAALRVGVPGADGPCGVEAPAPPTVSHVLWIWLENQSYVDMAGSPEAPYLNGLGRRCGVATNVHAVTHPSLPNYLAATSGLPVTELEPFESNCVPSAGCTLPGTGMFGLVPSWKAYQESMATPCQTTNTFDYGVRHNPPAYFADLISCATFDVGFEQLANDLAADELPAFSFVTPNGCNAMHDCSVAAGDTWLATHVPSILASPAYQQGRLVVFITFDEGAGSAKGQDCVASSDASCMVLTTVISPWTVPGTKAGGTFSHYSLLRTTLELLAVTSFPGEARDATSMRAAFNL